MDQAMEERYRVPPKGSAGWNFKIRREKAKCGLNIEGVAIPGAMGRPRLAASSMTTGAVPGATTKVRSCVHHLTHHDRGRR